MSQQLEDIQNVTVLGAGVMGRGISQVMAQAGYQVFMRDIQKEFLDSAMSSIKSSLQKFVEKGKFSKEQMEETLSKIALTTDLEEAVKDAHLVIEAVPEKMELKKEVFKQADQASNLNTILATNTSTLSITEIASAVNRPEKVVGMHFTNPVPLVPMVEIISGLLTSHETIEVIKGVTSKIGKTAIIVKDSPGFVSSRLGIALFLEASRMVEEGVASVKDIDTSMRLGYGHRMGPFETCDLVGLDARLNNIVAMYQATGDPQWRVPKLLKQLVASGYLGKKEGSKGGYYTYFGFKQ